MFAVFFSDKKKRKEKEKKAFTIDKINNNSRFSITNR